MQKKRFSLAVALPMYNEQDCAERAVRSIFPVLDKLPLATSLIVVNDGSKDRTGEIVGGLCRKFPRLSLLTHEVNRGYGGAIKTAYEFAVEQNIDYVLFMDADLTQDPRFIERFLPEMEAGVGVIKASRYVAGGGVNGVPLWRVVVSKVGNWLARRLYGLPIRDYTNGFRAVHIDVFRNFNLSSTGFDLLMEELYQAKYHGATFTEVPYILTARADGDGKSTFSYKPKVLYKYLRFGFKTLLRVPPPRPLAISKRTAPVRKAA